jgi:pyridinium-3,5-biscarboxylic acid mononucleotide sulfurtransferase
MDKKRELLREYIGELGRVAVAFSGGVDSSFLLAEAIAVIGENAIGITINSPALPESELDDAKQVALKLGAKHIIISSDEIEEEVRRNPADRCYHCKKTEFGTIIEEAAREGIEHVLDGSNADDTGDYRPGMNAVKELQVISPLLKFGITKKEIRAWSEEAGLPTWDKPAYACLYSRIPYGNEIKPAELTMVEKSEAFLNKKGFSGCRVRCHGPVARIEVAQTDIIKLISEPLKSEIAVALKEYGFKFITIDIEGYRMGSLNELL